MINPVVFLAGKQSKMGQKLAKTPDYGAST
jgi:hypothetical protein